MVHRFKNVGDTTPRMRDSSLPGGQDHYFKAISELAASGGLTGEKVMEINKKFDTNFLSATNLAALTAPIALFESLDGH